MEDFEISVVIPSYNGEKFIAEAIDCVLTQSYPAKEIIVVDDGSTDRTVEIVASMSGNIRLISQQHTGMPASGRNRGIRESRGNMIAFLDQDDIWPENALKIHVGNMIRYPGIFVDAGKVQKMVWKPGEDEKMNFEYYDLPKNFYLLSSLLIRKNVFEKIGLFDENLKFFGSDFDWLVRLREAEILINIHDQLTLFYRIHDQNHSNDHILLQQAMLEVFNKSLNRRRTGHPESLKPFPEFNTVANHPNLDKPEKTKNNKQNTNKFEILKI